MSSELKLLVNSRKYTRKLVTECHNKRATFSQLTELEKKKIKSELQDHLEALKKYNGEIQKLKWSEGEDESWLNVELDLCENYFVKIRECTAELETTVTPSNASADTARSLLKSPTAPLPEFCSHEGEDLLKFFKDFEDITSMFKYSDYDKFILLKQQISGRALVLLGSLESDKQGYVHAKKLLTDALASKDLRIFNTIKKISEITMKLESDPFEYISQVRNLTQSADSLSLGREDFLRYFFWHGLNDQFKVHLTQITNSTRPTLEQINNNFFEACERYNEQRKKFKGNKWAKCTLPDSNKNSKSSSNYATNVSYVQKPSHFFPCVLCSAEGKPASHPIYKCEIFPDVNAKLDKIKLLNGCLKCASLSHTAEKCNFIFKMKCKFCKAWHFSFLCKSKSKPEAIRESNQSESTQSARKDKKSTVESNTLCSYYGGF